MLRAIIYFTVVIFTLKDIMKRNQFSYLGTNKQKLQKKKLRR
jgi:hypothetical protein